MDVVNEMVVADLRLLRIWDFVPAGEDGHKTLEKARRYKADQISSLAACRSEIFGFGKSMSIPIDA